MLSAVDISPVLLSIVNRSYPCSPSGNRLLVMYDDNEIALYRINNIHKAFEKKIQKAKEWKITQKNGHSELLSRCLFKKSRKLINHIFNIFTFLPFVAKPADQRTKYLQNRCSFMRGICTKKIGAISQLGAEKSRFPLNMVDYR